MSTTSKLGIAAFIIASVTAYMAYVGSASGWQYYLSIEECLDNAPALVNQPIRVSGKVVAGTLTIGGMSEIAATLDSKTSLDMASGREVATFTISQNDLELPVSCTGPLPDNLAEDMEVVVEGRLDAAGKLRGDKVLTRCASKYDSTTELAARPRPARSAEESRR